MTILFLLFRFQQGIITEEEFQKLKMDSIGA
jgi:hypothetical protein